MVALEPRTGRVIAMASAPTFDLQLAVDDFDAIPDEGGPLLNRAVQGLYAPGSSFKVVTASEALESGSYTPESEFPGGAAYDTPGGPIRNFGGSSFGPHTLTTALTFSINTTFAEIGDALGAERLGEMMTGLRLRRAPADRPARGRGLGTPARRRGAAQRRPGRGHGPPGDRPGAAGGDAAADGDGRRRGRQRRHGHGAAPHDPYR